MVEAIALVIVIFEQNFQMKISEVLRNILQFLMCNEHNENTIFFKTNLADLVSGN